MAAHRACVQGSVVNLANRVGEVRQTNRAAAVAESVQRARGRETLGQGAVDPAVDRPGPVAQPVVHGELGEHPFASRLGHYHAAEFLETAGRVLDC